MSPVPQPFAPRTPRQERFLSLASELADRLSRDAARHDRDNAFPREQFDILRKAGYHTLTVPEELGGHGASLTETVLAQETLAAGDGAAALSIGWHLALIGKQAETRTWPPALFERICRETVEHGALLKAKARKQLAQISSVHTMRTAESTTRLPAGRHDHRNAKQEGPALHGPERNTAPAI